MLILMPAFHTSRGFPFPASNSPIVDRLFFCLVFKVAQLQKANRQLGHEKMVMERQLAKLVEQQKRELDAAKTMQQRKLESIAKYGTPHTARNRYAAEFDISCLNLPASAARCVFSLCRLVQTCNGLPPFIAHLKHKPMSRHVVVVVALGPYGFTSDADGRDNSVQFAEFAAVNEADLLLLSLHTRIPGLKLQAAQLVKVCVANALRPSVSVLSCGLFRPFSHTCLPHSPNLEIGFSHEFTMQRLQFRAFCH